MNTAALDSIGNLFDFVLTLINDYFVPLVFALAFVYFLWGAFQFFIVGKGSEEATQQGKKFLTWSIVGFVLMFSIWGIINLVKDSLPINNNAQPNIPTFDTNSSKTGTTNSATDQFTQYGG